MGAKGQCLPEIPPKTAQIFSYEVENAVLKRVRFRKHSNVGLYTGDRVLVLLMPLADPPLLVPYQRDAVVLTTHSFSLGPDAWHC